MSGKHRVEPRQERRPAAVGTRGGGAHKSGSSHSIGSTRGGGAQTSQKPLSASVVSVFEDVDDDSSSYYTYEYEDEVIQAEADRSATREATRREAERQSSLRRKGKDHRQASNAPAASSLKSSGNQKESRATSRKPSPRKARDGGFAPVDAGKTSKTSAPSHERPAPVAAPRSQKKVAQQMESRAPAVAGKVAIRGGKPAPAIRSPRGTVAGMLDASRGTVIIRRRVLKESAEARRLCRHPKESSAPAEAGGSRRQSSHPVRDESCVRAEAKQTRAPAEAGSSRSRSSRVRSPSVIRPGEPLRLLSPPPERRVPAARKREKLRSPSRSPPARLVRASDVRQGEHHRGTRGGGEQQQLQDVSDQFRYEEEDDDDDWKTNFPVLVLVMGVTSWDDAALQKLPALAVMVGMTDRMAQHVLGNVGKCTNGMLCCDGVLPQDSKPSAWPCMAASKNVFSSCTVVDRLFWHQHAGEPAEGMFIVQLGCKGTVCAASQVTVCVIAAGPHTDWHQPTCEKLAGRMAAWGLHMVVGLAAVDKRTRGHGDPPFLDHIEFVERTLRLKPVAHLQNRHFTCGGSVVWSLGSLEHNKIWWFLNDTIKCKTWGTGTVARCGNQDKERSVGALQRRSENMEARKSAKPFAWVKGCRRADPIRAVIAIGNSEL